MSFVLPGLANIALMRGNEINQRLKYLISRCAFLFLVAQYQGRNYVSKVFL